ncbi:MAG: hypothetical protein LBR87_00855, partial [Synergistaceae bacterium]|nr:hypothetical protein [Synergistaceae bacterium]
MGRDITQDNRIYYSKNTIGRSVSGYMALPRVRDLLRSAVEYPLVLVTAGAGYGKTRAVHSFLEQYSAATTWIQLSERDNAGARFWENFVHTISLYDKRTASRLDECGFPDTEEKFGRCLEIREDAIPVNEKYVTVFDDFHLIRDSSVLRFVEMSVNSPSSSRTTVIISRAEPEINTVSLLSKGLVVRISEDDLCFTEAEMAEYFGAMGVLLSAESAKAIYGDTGGWAFAVNLMGLSLLKGRFEGSARSAVKANVFKLIENEVFHNISERLQRFLVKLSLIDHLADGLVRTLAGDGSLVEELQRVSSFVRYDPYLDAYLIHHLFLDYLKGKQGTLTDEEKRDTYRKSARWCEQNDYKMDVISYYEKVEDYDAIITIISKVSIIVSADLAKFALDIYAKCPKEKLEQFARYHTHHLRLLISLGRFSEAMAEAREKVERFEHLPPCEYNNRVLCGAYRAISVIGWMTLPETDRCDFDVYMERANHYYELSPFRSNAVLNSCHMGPWASMVGTPRKGAMEEYLEALERTVPHSASAFDGSMYGMDDLAKGELFFFKGDMKNAGRFVIRAYYKAVERNQHEIRNRAVFYLLRAGVAQGD